MVGDWQEDYLTALRKGRPFDAIFILAKGYLKFGYAMLICSKFGEAIDFILKIWGIIEIFLKILK